MTTALGYLGWHRLLAYLRYFQQEGYEAGRFARWVSYRPLTDPAVWLAVVTAAIASSAAGWALVAFVVGAMGLSAVQPDPRRSGKIVLRLTWRAWRVLGTAAVLSTLAWVCVLGGFASPTLRLVLTGAAVALIGAPVVLVAANAMLTPYERHVQDTYEEDARRRLREMAPFVIGITGSYGKSSSKAMLAHLLQFHAPTLAASGSINTAMGVTRHIREGLLPGHRFMVVEMGAYAVGSIERLCALTPPAAALITAVGDMHLERFGSTEAIMRAKGELARAVPAGGVLVCNADSPNALRIAGASSHCRMLLYGERHDGELATRLEQVRFTARGTHFVLRTPGRIYECFTPLLGRPIVLNLAGVFTLACALGVDPDIAVAAMTTLRPVSNRLEVVEEAGVTWLRDAYNANQFGFRAALEVAAALPANRRVLVTPGVIELGAEQQAVNRLLSAEAAAVCSTTVVVSPTNREAFAAGHHDAGREAALVVVETRAEAFRWLRANVGGGDLVILENDLPDLYEKSAGVFWPSGRAES